MSSTPSALGTKPNRVLVDNLTIGIDSQNKLVVKGSPYTSLTTVTSGNGFTLPEISGGCVIAQGDVILTPLPTGLVDNYWVDIIYDSSAGGILSVTLIAGQTFTNPYAGETTLLTSTPGSSMRLVYIGSNLWALFANV